MTILGTALPKASPRPGRIPVGRPGAAFVLSTVLMVVAAFAASMTVAFPSLIGGVQAARGNLRGTALVMLIVGIPVLAVGMTLAARGSARGVVVWLGTLGYLAYQSVLFCFATPINNLFLLDIAYLGLSVWSIVGLWGALDLERFATLVSPRMPYRYIAVVGLVVTVLNSSAWLVQIVPAIFRADPGSLVRSSGLLTNPVFVQDLAIWLPLLAGACVATLRRESWGLLVTGAMLAMFVLESIGISADQWFGSQADPTSDLASASMTPVFAVVAVILAVPLVQFLRKIRRKGPSSLRVG